MLVLLARSRPRIGKCWPLLREREEVWTCGSIRSLGSWEEKCMHETIDKTSGTCLQYFMCTCALQKLPTKVAHALV